MLSKYCCNKKDNLFHLIHNSTNLLNVPLQHFLITEATIYNTDGRLLNQAWEFIRTPKSSGRWDNDVNYKGFEGLLGYDDSPKK